MVFNSASLSATYGGPTPLKDLLRQHQVDLRSESASAAPLTFSTPSSYSSEWLDVPVVTQAFGALPTKFGVATKDGVIQVNTEALEGLIDCGEYS